MALLCSSCKKRPVHVETFSFLQTTYCKFCKSWLKKNPLPFKYDESYKQRWEEADRLETERELSVNPSWKPATGPIAEHREKTDNSMKTGYIVMAFCGFFGLLIGGLGGALIGAALGFSITALVFAAQEGTKNL
ncbi:MAG TPA: hypothetical protein VD967_00495 [Candidatus Paceibacterota bacterium]|nr:hypothetical protein [Candidatus Paceibacterota bacterium]